MCIDLIRETISYYVIHLRMVHAYMCIDLICETNSYYVIHFWMAKAHECPLAAVCTAVSREA